MRVALVHDWLNGMRGGEKVFEVLCEIFPRADVYTLFYEPQKVSPLIRAMNIIESPVARAIPATRRHYRYLLPLLPSIVEGFPIKNYDLVVSTSHCVAKGVQPQPATTPHICYCFTPMRYVWEKYDDYFANSVRPAALLMPLFRKWLQEWDIQSAHRVSHFLTSSNYVRERIRSHYMREAIVIPAPVECARFHDIERSPGDFFLVVSALEPYKRVDIAIEAFRQLGLPLKVAGMGTQLNRLKKSAPPNVEFLGWVSDRDLAGLYSTARAVVFPTDEDFGIVPLEAAASGCPVIAYGVGGALETIRDGVTGILFPTQSAECLAEAVRGFDAALFDEHVLREHAAQFDRPVFKQRLAEAVQRLASAPVPARNGRA